MVEFDHFKAEAGLHTFVISASEWIEKTNAISITVKKGRYGGTYAHKDIAFTVVFVGLWESIHNLNFNCIEFEAIKNEAG